VPLERLGAGSEARIAGQVDGRPAVERLVAAAVAEVPATARADAHAIVGGDTVPQIEEGVELLGEEQSVLAVIRARAEVGLDVGGGENGLGVLAGDGAGAGAGGEEAGAEGALSWRRSARAKVGDR